ncbi:Gfo/Idh/MocA family oxidoreductase [candidate division KSB1 bacterium]|nr:Gfo/Idh/MocA family oxidoreductase [candidate division KSB1 bacterium]
MQPVKLGIIGCGIAARELHFPALQRLKNKFEITVVCNHTEPKAKSFAELAGRVPYVLDYHELLSRDDVEAVDIILPIHLNYSVTKDALEAGKHVIVEKPLAANLHEADQMLILDKRYPQVKMVAENFRYRTTFSRVKAILGNNKIGQPYAVFWNVFYFVNKQSKYAQTDWRIHHQYPGGFIMDGGVHNIAVLRDWFGNITSGIAFTKSINPEIGKLDSMSFQFSTESGVAGVFNVFFSSNSYAENRIIILGREGSLVIENNAITLKKAGEQDHIESIEDDGGYQGQFEDFYEAIRNGKPVKSSFSEGYQDFVTILKALDSAEKEQKFG